MNNRVAGRVMKNDRYRARRSLTSTCVMTEMAWRDRLMSSAWELAGALQAQGKRKYAWLREGQRGDEHRRPGPSFADNASKKWKFLHKQRYIHGISHVAN